MGPNPFDLAFLVTAFAGQQFPLPNNFVGNAPGELIESAVTTEIQKVLPDRAFLPYELLNRVFSDHPEAVTGEQRLVLLGPPALRGLLDRGRVALGGWVNQELAAIRTDTADVVVLPTPAIDLYTPTVHLIDVKSTNLDAAGAPPNIISAYKVAKMCATMISTESFSSHDITYVALYWRRNGAQLSVEAVEIRELFLIPPDQLRINWTAACQIQFHVKDASQGFAGTPEEWCRAYLAAYLASAEAREIKFRETFINPFLP